MSLRERMSPLSGFRAFPAKANCRRGGSGRRAPSGSAPVRRKSMLLYCSEASNSILRPRTMKSKTASIAVHHEFHFSCRGRFRFSALKKNTGKVSLISSLSQTERNNLRLSYHPVSWDLYGED